MIQQADALMPDRTAGPVDGFPIDSEASLKRFVNAFERGRLPISRWTHPVRLAMAVWYLWDRPEWEAAERYLNLLCRYSRCDEAGPKEPRYHETLALFWFILARYHVEKERSSATLLETVNGFVARFGTAPDLTSLYFSGPLLSSSRAHQTWVEPDLKSVEELAAELDRPLPATGRTQSDS